MPRRATWPRRALVVAGAVLLCAAPASAAHADASLKNWMSSFCADVGYYFAFAISEPVMAPGDTEILAVRRFVGELETRTRELDMSGRIGTPPVAAVKKLRARYRRAIHQAADELERASDLLARPSPSATERAAVVAHLSDGYNAVVAAVQRLHGHTGNARFDAAMLRNDHCAFLDDLEPVPTGSATA